MQTNHEYLSAGIFLNEDINIVKAAYENVASAERDPPLCSADVAPALCPENV